jgi:hypothetical protein
LKIFPAVGGQLVFAVPLPACDHVPHECKRPTNPFLSESVVWSPVSSGFPIPPDEVVHERVEAVVA